MLRQEDEFRTILSLRYIKTIKRSEFSILRVEAQLIGIGEEIDIIAGLGLACVCSLKRET